MNFYLSVNKNWINNTVLPDDYSKWDNFTLLQNKIDKKLLNIVKNQNYPLLNILYNSGIDNVSQISNISDNITNILLISNKSELLLTIKNLLLIGIDTLFNFGIEPDQKNNINMVLYLSQLNLHLPDISNYLDNKYLDMKNQYIDYISDLFSQIGFDKILAKQSAIIILELETFLAKNSLSRTELRDADKTYNSYNDNEFSNKYKNLDLKYLLNIPKIDKIIIDNPKYFKILNTLLSTYPIYKWKIYILYSLLNFSFDYLSDTLYSIKFNFFGKYINGQKKMKPKWKRVLNIVNNCIGDEIGKIYIKKHFSDITKNNVQKISTNIVKSMDNIIKNSKWMCNNTKKKALKKLHNIKIEIGYPKKWIDYSNIKFNNNFIENIILINKFNINIELSRLNKKTDNNYWEINPHTVNAYFHPIYNKIVIPASILQKPFYDNKQDIPLNYGGIGCIIGHELTHGFDDQGRKYDEYGNISDWWTKKDIENYQTLSKTIIDQFNNIKYMNTNINGLLTLGENIADVGGIRLSLNAYIKHNKNINLKLFFKAWASNWRCLITNKYAKNLILTDNHSPNIYRVNQILLNIDEFYNEYNINDKDKSYILSEKRLKIW